MDVVLKEVALMVRVVMEIFVVMNVVQIWVNVVEADVLALAQMRVVTENVAKVCRVNVVEADVLVPTTRRVVVDNVVKVCQVIVVMVNVLVLMV